jgi:thiamine-phosphate pyrophosphorylase
VSGKRLLGNKPLIYLITDGTATAANFTEKKTKILELIVAAVQTKISLIQIREKQLPARMLYELVAAAAENITGKTHSKLLVNDRADIALAGGADGVHLTSCSLSAGIIRRNFPKNFIVGASAHTIEKAEAARRQGADFVTFSPIYSSPGKGNPQGIEKLREVCEHLKPFPVIALGGIDATNFAEVLKTGVSGFAAIRFLNDQKNLRTLAADFGKRNS